MYRPRGACPRSTTIGECQDRLAIQGLGTPPQVHDLVSQPLIFIGVAEELGGQFEKWLKEAKSTSSTDIRSGSPKIILSPHAGYRYSGPTAAHSFLQISEHESVLERVIVVGPSHREHLHPFAQSTSYALLETPFGPLDVDQEIVRELGIGQMNLGTDIVEHSLEMQFPFLKYVLGKRANELVKIVPILVGHPSKGELGQLADLLYPYIAQEGTLMLVSSDFCHWGQSFDYAPDLSALSSSEALHLRIQRLDEYGMRAIESGPENFRTYLDTTGNTICGREPIRLALQLVQKGALKDGHWRWLHYSQSNQLTSPKSTSSQVSYASGAYFI